MKRLSNLLVLITLLTGVEVTQAQTQNWTGIGLYSDGSVQAFDSKSISRIGWPPQSVTIQTRRIDIDGKILRQEEVNYDCVTKLEKINNQPAKPPSDIPSAQKLYGFCGFNQADGHWFLTGADKIPGGHVLIYVDVSSIKQVDIPISSGTSIKAMQGAKFDVNHQPQLTVSESTAEIVLSCIDKEYYYLKNTQNMSFERQNLAGSKNPFPMAIHNLVCDGYFPASTQKISQDAKSPNNNAVSDAKKKCVELGFKSGTEGFGKCVLQLSK